MNPSPTGNLPGKPERLHKRKNQSEVSVPATNVADAAVSDSFRPRKKNLFDASSEKVRGQVRIKEKNGGICDVTRGRWVFNEGYPLYTNWSCPIIDEGFNCEGNGRLDKHYMKWRWDSGGQWNSGGHCKEATQPLNETTGANYPEKNLIVEEVIKQTKTTVTLFNITSLSEYRIDAHSSVNGRKFGKIYTPTVQDCSHCCLPGVPDTQNELLYFYLQSGRQQIL